MKNYDIVIVAHEKDFNNIKYIVEYSEKNLNFDSFYLILSERKEFEDFEKLKSLTTHPIYLHKETDVLKVDKNRISHRPNWIYQMLLKMFQNVTLNDNFLVIEADCIILSELNFFNEDRTIIYLARDQYHEQYFNFNKLFGFDREYNHSFISEFIMYDKKIINDMLSKFNCNSVIDFLEIVYNNTNSNCYLADYEFYGNFCYKYYREKIEFKNLTWDFIGKFSNGTYPNWSDSEINELIQKNIGKDVISFHTWGEN
jgi:hypothetical protein